MPPALQIFYIIAILLVLSIGVYFDISLSYFLTKKSNTLGPGQSRLIPWKSGSQQYNILVPVSATIVATVVSIFSTFMTGITILMVLKSQIKIVMICANVLISLESIAILGLTLRARAALKKKKPKPVIPKGPMFHDDVEKEESEIRTISASVELNQENQVIPLSNQISDRKTFSASNENFQENQVISLPKQILVVSSSADQSQDNQSVIDELYMIFLCLT